MTKVIVAAIFLSEISSIFTGVFLFITSQRLSCFLRKNKHERWAELTTLQTPTGELEPGGTVSWFLGKRMECFVSLKKAFRDAIK